MSAGHGAAAVSLYGRLRNRHVRESLAGAGPEVPRIPARDSGDLVALVIFEPAEGTNTP